MAFCPNCGTEASGRFCPKCGTPVAAAGAAAAPPQPAPQYAPPQQPAPQYSAPQPQYQQPQYQQPPYQQPQYQQPQYQQPNPQYGVAPQAGGLTDNVAGALCYLGWVVTGVIFLVVAPYNQSKFIRFHAFQSIGAFAVLFIFQFAFGILIRLLAHMIPFLSLLLLPVGLLLWLLWPLSWIFLMYKAYNNEKFKLPVIGELAENQA